MASLSLDPEGLNACVQCGLCLPHCPTYRASGDEAMSPRGRISLMRAVVDGAPTDDDVVRAMATCVQCRGCEPACPSEVPFGELIAETRSHLRGRSTIGPRWLRAVLFPLGHPSLLRVGSRLLAVGQRLGLPTDRFGIAHRLPLRDAPLTSTGDDVWLFTGCVQDAWTRSDHRDALEVLSYVGVGAQPTGDSMACCGALHHHAGFDDDARRLAAAVVAAAGNDDRPIVVDSAGCGAALKEYGQLLGTAEAEAFAARVVDIAEFVAPRFDPTGLEKVPVKVAISDPCHLRHVQRSHLAVRQLLDPVVEELVELDDDGLCCGAGGAYSVMEPELARTIRDRKLGHIGASGAQVVAAANPGCVMHLEAAGVDARHPISLLAEAVRTARRAPSQ